MTKETFLQLLTEDAKTYKNFLETKSHDWIVKGFIDVDKNVYTISNDTKVVSKIIEILLITIFHEIFIFFIINRADISKINRILLFAFILSAAFQIWNNG